MALIDHGAWERYTPDPPKPGLPTDVMFARRVVGGEDWYEYVASKPFNNGSVVMTVERLETGDIIQAATRDPTAIFPARMSVIEETEYTRTDPQTDFGRRTYNADLRKILPKE